MTKKPRIHSGGKIVSSINDVGKIGYSHAKEWNWIPILHHSKTLTHWEDPEELGGEGGGRGGSGWGIHVTSWLIHVNVWKKHYNIVK